MGFFNDIGRKGAEATSKIAKEGKLKLKIAENKGKIKDEYTEIGRIVYENHIKETGFNINDLISEHLKALDNLSLEIESARKEILTLNQKKLCTNCFEEISDTMAFCPKCGAKQEDKQSVKEEALENLENAEIKEEKKEEAEVVKQELEQAVEEEKKED